MKLIFSVMLLTLFTGFRERNVVSGKVISFEESFPIEGVTVSIKGRDNATGTMFDGSWCLKLSEGDSILVFTHEEYERQEVRLEAHKTDYNIVLTRK